MSESDLEAEEGKRLKVYDDKTGKPIVPGYTVIGHPTIGVGRALDTKGITDEEAEYLLANDMKDVEAELDRNLPWWRSRPDPVRRSLGDMCFELGITGLLGFKKMLSCIQAGDYAGARKAAWDSDWAREVPSRAGLVISRFRDG